MAYADHQIYLLPLCFSPWILPGAIYMHCLFDIPGLLTCFWREDWGESGNSWIHGENIWNHSEIPQFELALHTCPLEDNKSYSLVLDVLLAHLEWGCAEWCVIFVWQCGVCLIPRCNCTELLYASVCMIRQTWELVGLSMNMIYDLSRLWFGFPCCMGYWLGWSHIFAIFLWM